jgi:peptide/nickel transport system substrate-binding protein
LLAKSWSQPDATTYELELKDNVTWHDGQEFTADDVVYTLNYITDPKVKLRLKASWSWIASVEKLSPTKVRIRAKEPIPDALMWLSFGTPMYPRHLHQPLADKGTFGTDPVGTGPYKMVKLDKNTGIVAERNTAFVRGPKNPAAAIGRVVAKPIQEAGTMTAALLADKADEAVDLPIDEAESLAKTGRFEVMLAPPRLGYIFLQFPTAGWANAKPLADQRVREAIVKAIDRRALLKSVYGPLADRLQPTEALCSKEQLGCGYTKPVPAYDPAAAKKLLAEAGYPDGFDVTISAYRDNLDDATAISGMLRKIGIRMNVKPILAAQRSKFVHEGDVQVGYFGWSGGNMFTVAPQVVRHFQTGEYRDGAFAKLIAPISTTMDDAERRKASAKAFDYLTEKAYAFAMIPNREVYTLVKGLAFRDPDALRPAQLSPHEFYWK